MLLDILTVADTYCRMLCLNGMLQYSTELYSITKYSLVCLVWEAFLVSDRYIGNGTSKPVNREKCMSPIVRVKELQFYTVHCMIGGVIRQVLHCMPNWSLVLVTWGWEFQGKDPKGVLRWEAGHGCHGNGMHALAVEKSALFWF